MYIKLKYCLAIGCLLVSKPKKLKEKKLEFDQTDHIIVSLLNKLAPHVGSRGILTIFLAKLLFLIDYEYFKATGRQATDFRYVWYKHGPYPLIDFEERLQKLDGFEIIRLPMTREVDGRPYNLFYAGTRPRFTPHLDKSISSIVDRTTEIFKDANWETLRQYVYSIDVVRGLQFDEVVDFNRIRGKTEDEVFLEKIASAFREELTQPLSVEHIRAIQRALSEPTNENIETAKRMLARQRAASRLS